VVLHGAQVRKVTEGVDTANDVLRRRLVLTQHDKDALVGNTLAALKDAVRHQAVEQLGLL
jgi:hypothetical protein